MKTNILSKLILMSAIFYCSCGSATRENDVDSTDSLDMPVNTDIPGEDIDYPTASASISNASGSKVSGTAIFMQNGDSTVVMKFAVQHIKPGLHAVHIHENGDCSADDASSAGGHWNPTQKNHGKRGEGEFHKGDITNVEVNDDSTGQFTITIQGWTIGGSEETNILNRALIVHDGSDDFTSQPSGNAGNRVACGVITNE